MRNNQSKWVEEYKKVRPTYVQFTEKLESLFREMLQRKRIQYHLIEPRTKTLTSFKEKITRQDKSYKNPLQEVTDLSGIRVVVYYLEDLNRVAKLIIDEFEVDKDHSVDKTEILKAHEFGYRAIHYVISLSENRKNLLEWKDFKSFKAEIQIRTVLQHAWAAIDHTLRYKKRADIPYQFRRKLFRLSGILELADEEFSVIRTDIESLRKELKKKIEKDDIDLEINVDTLTAYMKSTTVQSLVRIAKNVDIARVKIEDAEKSDYSQLVQFCKMSGLKKISEINELLKINITASKDFFEKIFTDDEWGISIPYFPLYLLTGIFADKLSPENMEKIKKQWNKKFLSRMINYGGKYLKTR